ncbi:Chain A, A Mutant Of Trypanosoma Rangeli Sialidase Displaying Trans- Sialidase Activity, partial [Trypanosoma theileri]
MSLQAEWKARRSMCKTLLYVELVFLLLVLFCSGTAQSSFTRRGGPKRKFLFRQGKTSVPFEEDNGTITKRVVHSFRIPSLVEVNGVLVAIADARYISGDDQSFIETVVKYSVDGGSTWKTQIAIKNSRVNVNRSRVMDPTVIVKGNKLYVTVAGFYESPHNWVQQPDGSDWYTLLAIGEVNKWTVNGKPIASITWTKPVSLSSILPKWVDGVRTKQFIAGVGPSIVTSNGTLLFPVQVSNFDKRVSVSMIYSVDDGATWAFSKGFTPYDCTESAVVEWEEGKLILNSRRDNGYRRVFESSDMGETWKEALGTLSHVWGNSPSRTGPGCEAGFIAATIEGKRVMLFTHPLNFQGAYNRDRLHLWMTDNQRIFDVGQISHGVEKTPYSSLLYTDDKLFCLHEIKTEDEIYSIVLSYLENELQLMKSVLTSWKDQDEYLSGICPSAASVVPSQKGECN